MSGPWEDYGDDGPWTDYQNGVQTKSEQAIGWLPAIANTITQGATFGWADEISAGMDAAVRAPFSDKKFGELYDENLAVERDRLQRSREQWPKLSFASELAGGIATGSVGGRALAKGGGEVLRRVPGSVRLAGGGAAGGATYGAGAAEEGGRLRGAAIGGGIGAVATPVAGAAISGGATILRKLGQPIVRALNNAPEAQAERIIRTALEQGDISDDFIREELARLGPQATLADVADSFQRLARGTATLSGRGSSIAREALETRAKGQQSRLLGGQGVPEFKRWFHSFRNSRITAADDLYEQARNTPIEFTTTMRALMKRPSIAKALEGAENVIKEQGGSGGHIEVVQAVKEQLDDEIGAAIRKGENNVARRLIETKKAFLAEVDAQNPAYAQARQVFAGEAAIKDAAEEGAGIWRGRTDIDAMETLIEGYTESESAAFRAGALRGLIDKIESVSDTHNAAARITGSPRVRQLLRMVFPSDEAFEDFLQKANAESRFAQTKNMVLGGSPTMNKASDMQSVRDIASAGAAMARGNDPVAMAIGLLKSMGFGDVSDETLERVARILFTPGAELPKKTVQNISPRIRQQAPRIVKQAEVIGGTNALLQPQLVEGP